ncbi:hypothetical protein Q7P37_005145 [Cladosporium fusiforme]
MSASGAGPLVPTFTGFVQNSMDGLILFEACLSGKLHHVPRRPHDRERNQLIKSGNIFIYEENASGIKRWTDGVAWSPSRILGNFLIYRELDKPFPPGEKKRAIKRKRSSLPGEGFPRRDSDPQEHTEMQRPITPPEPSVNGDAKPSGPASEQDKELERSLIGSLVDSYGFRSDGLVKKTMSISINGISHHMVSYYKVDDVKHNVLARPLQDPRLQHISVRPELYLKQNFRAPIEETEHYAIDGQMHAHPQVMYASMGAPGQPVRPGAYYGGGQYPGMYAPMTTAAANPAALYSAMPGTQWGQPLPSGYTTHQGYTTSSYGNYYKPGSQSSTTGKPEDSHSSSQAAGYSNPYPASYPGMQRDGSHSSSGMMPQSSYQTPVAPSSSTFGSMSAPTGRSAYSGSVPSPTTAGQSHQMYGAPQGAQSLPTQYAVRSPSQSYGMQGAPPSAASQHSPHSTMKSPHSAAPPSGTPVQSMPHDPYRSGSYTTPNSAHPSSDMSGLGISGSAGYGHSYSSSGQNFRPVGEVAAAQGAGGHYSQ